MRLDPTGPSGQVGDNWYGRSSERVAADLGVDPAVGVPPERASELLVTNGPNTLPQTRSPFKASREMTWAAGE